jgi:phage tail-like protein
VRGMVDGLLSAHPIGGRLPSLYQDDDLAQRFTAALDEVLAPVFTTLDNIEAYVDPRLAPLDFVEWLGGWLGVELDGGWPSERRRTLVARAAQLYAWQGTARGLAELVEIYTGVVPEVEDSGGVGWSATPEGEFPGTSQWTVTVRVRVDHDDAVDPGKLDRLVARAKPAHVAHRVEVVQ